MPKDQPRTRIQKRNRETILEAALDAFSEAGFNGTTLDRIAERAGLSKPNLIGMAMFHWRRLRHAQMRIIEYK